MVKIIYIYIWRERETRTLWTKFFYYYYFGSNCNNIELEFQRHRFAEMPGHYQHQTSRIMASDLEVASFSAVT